ncbi:MAG: dTDP-4-amino-4,6-dideoxygalactose transaminase [Treponema sp.]|uniref:dTDP-4-amino-4,6-dideoxy-D-glucose transaminase n=1 Tax=Treponema socranskii subsp. socranskii VPI DR56BR1116 = ATCC 35536 TaxID=1125725 RepID=U2MPV6_TRESO|nr:dTDP-4-amino-4,6-dideoxygalactose transaminase [Treponema socranskii]ERF59990.1 dTDP-4-amino-4,6-dideoxy-D-glucose transaminase [Treponema socranskii subsp. socranskii VPI DR56BR1116 = ATCC 35536]ERK01319.1 dTDP-4-amino-4,6-dideoxy-D-glucose transaminase [Treponema socranskii subsp. socranskii VPI DR56BR1116 = ATCC 35536]
MITDMIPFNVPPVIGTEIKYIQEAIHNRKLCGDGPFTKRCTEYLQKKFNRKILLTTSCTSALEMAALLCHVKNGDEVILPSYTFCSTADAFVQRGAKLVFVDIRPDTLNIDENKIEKAITPKTKAIVVVHYAGVVCEMDTIMDIARRHNIFVIEDAAQAIFSTYKNRLAGTIGDFGCLSFHETKNLSMGEGGALIINHDKDSEEAEMIREKGTDRSRFIRGEVDKYTWRTYGSSYLPSDLNAAYLWGQLESADIIQNYRMNVWNTYFNAFTSDAVESVLRLPLVPSECKHNAHIFYLIAKDPAMRNNLIAYLRKKEIQSVFHYIPLHSAPAGIIYGRFDGKDIYTTQYSERLIRLPLYYGIRPEEQDAVITAIRQYVSDR